MSCVIVLVDLLISFCESSALQCCACYSIMTWFNANCQLVVFMLYFIFDCLKSVLTLFRVYYYAQCVVIFYLLNKDLAVRWTRNISAITQFCLLNYYLSNFTYFVEPRRSILHYAELSYHDSRLAISWHLLLLASIDCHCLYISYSL